MRSPPSMRTRRRSTTVSARSSCGLRCGAAALAGLDDAHPPRRDGTLRVGDRTLNRASRDGPRRALTSSTRGGIRSPRRPPLRHVLVRVGGHPARAGHVPCQEAYALVRMPRRAAPKAVAILNPRRRPMVRGPDHRIRRASTRRRWRWRTPRRPPERGAWRGGLCPLPRPTMARGARAAGLVDRLDADRTGARWHVRGPAGGPRSIGDAVGRSAVFEDAAAIAVDRARPLDPLRLECANRMGVQEPAGRLSLRARPR